MTKATDNDIENDPMFDVSDAAKKRASNRRLLQYFERVDRLEEEKKGIADDIKDVWAEVKAVGYDTKIGRKVYALWKMKPDDRAELETLIDLYKDEIGI